MITAAIRSEFDPSILMPAEALLQKVQQAVHIHTLTDLVTANGNMRPPQHRQVLHCDINPNVQLRKDLGRKDLYPGVMPKDLETRTTDTDLRVAMMLLTNKHVGLIRDDTRTCERTI